MKAPELLTYDKSRVTEILVTDAIVEKTATGSVVAEKGIRMLLEDGRKLWLPLP